MFSPPRDHVSIIKEYQKYGKLRLAPHRPYLISDNKVEDVKNQLLNIDDYLSIGDISICLSLKFNTCPSRNIIKKMIKERITGYTIITVNAIDTDRNEVTCNPFFLLDK